MTFHIIELARSQDVPLCFRFHAFGDHLHAQRARQFDDVEGHQAGRRVGAQRVDEHLVDLQEIQFVSRQVRKIGVSCAEIVDRHAEAARAHSQQHIARFFGRHQPALGDLEHQTGRLDLRALRQLPHVHLGIVRMQVLG
ncbi:hypothetical protein D3C77_601740 [compost metagenome]